MSQPLNTNGSDISQLNLELNQLEQVQLQQLQMKSQPSMFRRVLGGIAGGAGNMFVPGLGGALGSVIGGRTSSSLSSGALGSLFQTNATSQFSSQLAGAATAGNVANLISDERFMEVARQGNEIEESVELASNIEKQRHDTLMSVIQNIGS